MKTTIKNTIRVLSILVLFFFALSYYSYLVYNAAIDGRKSGFIAHHLTNFANYPNLIKDVLTSSEVSGIPPTYMKEDDSFQEVNHLNYDLYALNSFWNMHTKGWDIVLFNLKNDTVAYKWTLSRDFLDFSTSQYNFTNAVPRNCIVFHDKSLIVSADETANLLRIDSNSKVMWSNHKVVFHHAMNLDADSNIWACTADLKLNGKMPVKTIRNIDGKLYRYKEDYITKIDKNTGKILFHKGISELLVDNHYSNFVYGFSDPDRNTHDPIHLNDIQPALKDTKYWKQGDLFISIRHRSLIVLYRPSTNKIIRLIFGEFINQHDVDIISDSEISIFNNNFIHLEEDSADIQDDVPMHNLASSDITTYNFVDSSFKKHLDQYFIKEKIWTETQGMHNILQNGDVFVESQNQGRLFILNNSGIVLKKTLHAPIEHYIYHPNWIRIYQKLPY